MSQDGADFYDEDSGEVIFTAQTPVKDFDLKAAEMAMQEFITWAGQTDLDFKFVWENDTARLARVRADDGPSEDFLRNAERKQMGFSDF